MKITVTQQDINNAKDSASSCPIALATKRAINKRIDVYVERSRIEFEGKGFCYRTVLPSKATVFVKSFDEYRKVEPFSFEIKNILAEFKSKVEVSVTKNDLKYEDARSAVKRAIRRALKIDNKDLSIDHFHNLEIKRKKTRIYIALPARVSYKMTNHNRGKLIKPFSFELKIPKLND